MRTWAVVGGTVLGLGVLVGTVVAANDTNGPCIASCNETRDTCVSGAADTVNACRDKAFEVCDQWCLCTQFIGAAHFACLLQCDTCKAGVEEVANECPDRSAVTAECTADHRTCVRRCK